ncbi:helix-turn-helix domain-containing protein [Elizabethkingia anophelis]|uniref:Helix-turn-helix domain-containing protein n=1 Tax=Chryseobacterium manosquense TaxID=2754694 RepID=A0A7H1DTM6_9FLAO|nr:MULTISPECIES: helix-turn-helix domain-containing protein [Weeksellaceae]MCT3629162.1 helix-turn-helix domain-containing protein [Elizabethkingia anophelis]MCT3632991.1 helix-turn-helix domain-containing protein [Elizabethkingia anophelis]MCT3829406.1 helix-turn-helix domain-containing protein [Elizabethkingia anophelis]MCT3882881.1 helix-turn-helix domain-containing protein [Elizabethkingia anophelis]MCT3893964.1 helix-turn-helix domain-containing protein [Elizabethkingia anophelis]
MEHNEISFENLPSAVAHLNNQVEELKELILRKESVSIPQKKTPIDIEKACEIIGKAKPTVYTLVRTRQIPCYKSGKKLYFFEDELLEWIRNGRRKTMVEIEAEAEKNFRRNRG